MGDTQLPGSSTPINHTHSGNDEVEPNKKPNSRRSSISPLLNLLVRKRPFLSSLFRGQVYWSIRQSAILAFVLFIVFRFSGFTNLFNFLEVWELQTFDFLVTHRPYESLDDRILIIGINQDDVIKQAELDKSKQNSVLKDSFLIQLLKKLEERNARLIGLDIYRDYSSNINKQLRSNNRLITICDLPDPEENGKTQSRGEPVVPEERVGFADIPRDLDKVVRRHFLEDYPVTSNPPPTQVFCNVTQSFSLLLAKRYLELNSKNVQYISPSFPNESSMNLRDLQIDSTTFPWIGPFLTRKGVYSHLPNKAYMTLLNYRNTNGDFPAKEVGLFDVLKGRADKDIEGRIILIGAQDEDADWATPYGTMAGITLHAHMVSQILAAVLDDRKLLRVFPVFYEFLWVLGWSLFSSLLILSLHFFNFNLRFPSYWSVGLSLLGLIPLIISYVFLVIWGYWLASVPMTLAYYLSGIRTVFSKKDM